MPVESSSSNKLSSGQRESVASRLVASPSLEIPHGGGSLKGIDETFRSNPVTGSATLTLPLPVSASRNDFVPELNLGYDSGSGNGAFGLGWSLSVPHISRKTDRGVPRYDDSNESDEFVLSGSEDLVPTGEERTEGPYHIRRYRPRVESGFARIEQWRDESSGLIHWRTVSADNITRLYGQSTAACLSDPANPRRIFRWYLEFSHDGKGNAVSYTWKAEDAGGVAATLSECNRLNGTSLCTNLYLKKVSYGNARHYDGVTHPSDWHFDLVFDYGEHGTGSRPTFDESAAWTVRPDSFSSYRPGFDIRTRRRCKRVLMYHRFDELDPTPRLVRSLDFEYGAGESGISLLVSATRHGYRQNVGGTLEALAYPAMTFFWQSHEWNETVHTVDSDSLSGLPLGLRTPGAHFLDLYGEGLSGILIEQDHGWYYKRNEGHGRFGTRASVHERPFTGNAAGIQALEGDTETYLVDLAGDAPGFYRFDNGEAWQPHQTMAAVPNINLNDPSVRVLDLDGDGRADLLVDEGSSFLYYRSEGKKGYSLASRIGKGFDEEKKPRVVFSEAEQTLFLADMSGDGLTDIVRIRNGSICYWPNLGHGRFGTKVGMEGSPLMDKPEQFNASRVRLADVDGSGPADLIYLCADKVKVWLNRSGNGFNPVRELAPFCAFDNESYTAVLDFLGEGTACVVWSSPLAMNSASSMRYLDLTGGRKPDLMMGYDNGFGRRVALEYTPSTKFYLDDRATGKPWVTKLPFPVHCLSRVETRDLVTGWTHASRYSYHHGYYDIPEREFRGFGCVEVLDSEDFEGYAGGTDSALHQPPVLTRTWYHLGAQIRDKGILEHYESEYHAVYDAEPRLSPPAPGMDWTVEEQREALRAFKGLVLRREIYSPDGSALEAVPYITAQTSYRIERLEPKGEKRHACFHTTQSESLSHRYERNVSDPRKTHTLVLDNDRYGRPTLSATIAFGRVPAANPAGLPAEVSAEQQKTHIVLTATRYASDVESADAFRMGAECSVKTWELTGIHPSGDLFTAGELLQAFSYATELPFEAELSGTAVQKRLVEHVETLYYSNDLSEALPLGEMAAHGLVYENYTLSHTPSLLTYLYDDRVTDAMITEGGFVSRDGNYWARTGRNLYNTSNTPANSANHFYLPIGIESAFGEATTVTYDNYKLLITSATDALGNTVIAENDYRTLTPRRIIDPNGNRTEAETDALGIVIKTAIAGKNGEGDTLADPTAHMEYGFAAFDSDGTLIQPSRIKTYRRETHGNQNTRWLQNVEYSDGAGNVVLVKAQAEPGTDNNPRWVGTGRTILNNKGNPVKQYEPYFSDTDAYESEPEIVETGVTPVLYYDALNRLIRTDFPDGSHSKTEFTAWQQTDFDRNDTAEGNPHYNTPAITHFDSLGRAFCNLQDNGTNAQGLSLLHVTLMELDIEGNEKKVIDARGNTVMEYRYGIHGEKGYSNSMDAGERWLFLAADGQPLYTWDSRGHRLHAEYDELRRPVKQWLSTDGGTETLVAMTVYGEEVVNPEADNMRGQVWKNYDQSGLAENIRFDFKGNLLEGKRRFTTEYRQTIDWNVSNPDSLLQSEEFTTITAYDALNRATEIRTPHNNNIPANEIQPAYDEGGLLKSVHVHLREATNTTDFVSNISYNPKGQRERISYGNGATTRYDYDERTFRLTRLLTTRNNGTEKLQDLNYTYDPVGNITQIADHAQESLFFDGQVVSPSQTFEYNALYRLTRATGREHAQRNTFADSEGNEYPQNLIQYPLPSDATALRNYVRQWEYDEVGNILNLIHQANGNSFTRNYEYVETSNRLISTSIGQSTINYSYNEHGSMASMPHLDNMEWNFAEQLSHVIRGTTETYYNYDGSAQRTRKVVEKGNIVEERLYLGGFEIYRKRNGNTLETERETLHVMDDKNRIALAETLTVDNGTIITNPTPVQRYQLSNNIESATMELDENASIISYEEYYPYGETSYQAGRSDTEVSQKRYRYTGKEKDEESGLYYHGARYYICWLGRWTASDPAGMVDGVNLYMYCRGNPVKLVDKEGMASIDMNEVTVKPYPETQTIENKEGKVTGSFNETSDGVLERKIPKYLYINGQKASGVVQVDKEMVLPEISAGNIILKKPELRTLGEMWAYLPDTKNGMKGDGGYTYQSPKYEMSIEEASHVVSDAIVYGIAPRILALFANIQLGTPKRAIYSKSVSALNRVKTTERVFSKEANELYKFSKVAAKHMNESTRAVPVQLLDEVIKAPMAVVKDPRTLSKANMYYSQIHKNGKLYNIEVLYDETTNMIMHFKYTQNAIGPLKIIGKR
jgi:RHS repeat-associated protein